VFFFTAATFPAAPNNDHASTLTGLARRFAAPAQSMVEVKRLQPADQAGISRGKRLSIIIFFLERIVI
jgi:hypothetical protein